MVIAKGLDIYAGRTLLLGTPNQIKRHLWIVLTNPKGKPNDEKVAMVNFTSLKQDSDTTIVLESKDHPFVRHETVVYYQDARLAEVILIQKAVKQGLSSFHDDCSNELLEKIQLGLLISPLTPKNIKSYCQELFDNY
jgi:hypothetical protein